MRQAERPRCPRCDHANPPEAVFCANCGSALAGASSQPLTFPTPGTAQARPAVVIPEEYVGFWIRLVAAIIDGVIVGVISGVLQAFGGPVGMVVSWVVNVLYYVLFTGLRGQTPGKMLIGAKVVDSQGRVPGLWKAFLREVIGRLISSVFLFLGYVWIAFDSKKQGWHDKIAGTFVVRSRPG